MVSHLSRQGFLAHQSRQEANRTHPLPDRYYGAGQFMLRMQQLGNIIDHFAGGHLGLDPVGC